MTAVTHQPHSEKIKKLIQKKKKKYIKNGLTVHVEHDRTKLLTIRWDKILMSLIESWSTGLSGEGGGGFF